MTTIPGWEGLCAAHRKRQELAIPIDWSIESQQLEELKHIGSGVEGRLIEANVVRESGLLSEVELAITQDFTAVELLKKISSRELSSLQVVQAFGKRAALAQQLTSCLTEIFFVEAMERARWLDQQLLDTGKVVGPLHGLPVSLKDCFVVAGHYATAGYVEFLKRPVPTSNSALVSLLLDAGAILYCKTNLPQTMMTADSDNNIFGRTLNPHNTRLTAGGSSGGEGALIAFRGSILGIGTDIAGSVRIPSLCCGVYGFKPTANRVPFAGQSSYPFPEPDLPGIAPVAGPIATSVDDLMLLMTSVIGKRPWMYDVTAMDIPWRATSSEDDAKLTIGVLAEDPDHVLHPPVRRSLEAAVVALQAAGHKTVRLPANPMHDAGLAARIAWQYFSIAVPEGEEIETQIGEPLVQSVVRGFHPFTTAPLPVSPESDILSQLSGLAQAKEAFTDAWRRLWLEYSLDVVLAPGAMSTATPHDTYGVPVYTVMWNVTDFPAGIIPFGQASKESDGHHQKATAAFDPDYDPETYDRTPCALQVVAPRFRDEECLAAMKIIDRDIRLAATSRV